MLNADQLRSEIVNSYNDESNIWHFIFIQDYFAIYQVKQYLTQLNNNKLPEKAAYQITLLMLDRLMQAQENHLNRKSTTLLGNKKNRTLLKNNMPLLVFLSIFWIYGTFSKLTYRDDTKFYLLFSLIGFFYYILSIKIQQATPLTETPIFFAWEKMMEKLGLVTPSGNFISIKDFCIDHINSTDVIEWLYLLKKHVHVVPSDKSFVSRKILFAIKEKSIKYLLSEENIAESFFSTIEQDIFLNSPPSYSTPATRIMAKLNPSTGKVQFFKKTTTPQELLNQMMDAYNRVLSFQEAYLTQEPKPIQKIKNYLQTLVNENKDLPNNIVFEFTTTMYPTLYNTIGVRNNAAFNAWAAMMHRFGLSDQQSLDPQIAGNRMPCSIKIYEWLIELGERNIFPTERTYESPSRFFSVSSASIIVLRMNAFTLTQDMFSLLEKHATPDIIDVLIFMRNTYILTEDSFQRLLIDQNFAVLMTKNRKKNLCQEILNRHQEQRDLNQFFRHQTLGPHKLKTLGLFRSDGPSPEDLRPTIL